MIIEMNPNILVGAEEDSEETMRIGEDFQARIDQLGPGIYDENAAGCASILLQGAGIEANYPAHRAARPRLSPGDKCCFGFDDVNYLNQLGPRVDDEAMLEYMSYVLA